MLALVALIIIAIFRSQIVESIILGSAVMDEYKFVNPSAPPACVKAFSLPPAYLDQIQFQPPTLPQNWGDKGAEGKQKLATQMTTWITTILIVITLLAILYTIFKKCRYVSSLQRVCFPLYPFSTILRGTACTDIFLDRNIIKLPALGKISLWSTNDLASIETNIPYQIRVYRRVLDLVIPLEIKDDVHITDHRLY